MSIKNVVRIERLPSLSHLTSVWCIELECGHKCWWTAKRKPTVKQLRCEKCEANK